MPQRYWIASDNSAALARVDDEAVVLLPGRQSPVAGSKLDGRIIGVRHHADAGQLARLMREAAEGSHKAECIERCRSHDYCVDLIGNNDSEDRSNDEIFCREDGRCSRISSGSYDSRHACEGGARCVDYWCED